MKWLQGALGITTDGMPGPKTVATAKGADPVATVKRICAKRPGFLRGLSTFTTFGKGWVRRVVGVEAKGVAMASATPRATAAVEARKAANTASTQKAAAAASGAGAGERHAGGPVAALDAASSVALMGVAAVLIVVVVVLIARSRVYRARAEAHAAVAEGALS